MISRREHRGYRVFKSGLNGLNGLNWFISLWLNFYNLYMNKMKKDADFRKKFIVLS